MADQEINIKLNGIAQIRSELKALKSELINATDPKQMEELAERAGELSDKLKDANERAAVFASGSRFEQTSNAFGLMQSQLMDMDFEGAAESAKMFAGSLGKIDGKSIAGGIKGIISVVTMLGGAFIRLGIQILANPIFLLIAVIVAIVAAIVIFGKNLGFVKKMMAALTAVLDSIIAALKAFSDMLGLSSYAAQDNAKKQVEAMKEVDKARETQLNNYIRSTEMTIKLQEIEGKDTYQLEQRKREAIIETSRTRYYAALDQIDMMRQTGEADQEEIKKLYERAKTLRETIDKESADIRIAQAQRKQDKKKAAEEEAKEDEKNAKTAAENARKWRADRLAAERQIDDLRMSLIVNDQEREIAINLEKYKRLRADLLTNEKLTKEERKTLKALYDQEELKNTKEINQKYIDAEKKKQEEITAKWLEGETKRLADEDAIFAMRQALTQTQKEAEIAQIVADNEEKLGLAGITAADEALIAEDTAKRIKAINDKYREEEIKDEEDKQKEKFEIAQTYAKSVNNLVETAFTLSERFGKQDEVSKEKRAKRQFQISKAMQLSMAIMDGFKAANASLAASPLTVLGVPNPGAIAAFAFAVSTSLANVAKIASTQYGSKNAGGAAGGSAASGGGGMAAAGGGSPSFSLFGQGNNLNTTSGPKDAQNNSSQLMVKAIVVESDVTSTQNKVKKMQENATL